jgi:hypothetical protein
MDPSSTPGSQALDYTSMPEFLRLIIEEMGDGVRVTDPGSGKIGALFGAGVISAGVAFLAHSLIQSATRNEIVQIGVTVIGIMLAVAIFLAALWRARQATVLTLAAGKFLLDRPLMLSRQRLEIPFEHFRGFTVWMLTKGTSLDFRTLGALSLSTLDGTYYIFRLTPVDELQWLARFLALRAGLAEELVQISNQSIN